MKLVATCWALLVCAVARGEEWKPPEKPDPQVILNEARADTEAHRYETALAKYVWFHDNALKYQPALSGVRLSFALSDWGRLADTYPPALAKMKETRDQLKDRIQKAERVASDDFQDFTALNRELDNESGTAEMFLALDARSPKTAKRLFPIAEPALVRAKEYAICGKHIDSEQAVGKITKMFNLMQAMEKDGRIPLGTQDFRQRKFINDSAVLVAVLTKNGRTAEAEQVVGELRKVPMDPELLAKLNTELTKALQGIVPAPWP